MGECVQWVNIPGEKQAITSKRTCSNEIYTCSSFVRFLFSTVFFCSSFSYSSSSSLYSLFLLNFLFLPTYFFSFPSSLYSTHFLSSSTLFLCPHTLLVLLFNSYSYSFSVLLLRSHSILSTLLHLFLYNSSSTPPVFIFSFTSLFILHLTLLLLLHNIFLSLFCSASSFFLFPSPPSLSSVLILPRLAVGLPLPPVTTHFFTGSSLLTCCHLTALPARISLTFSSHCNFVISSSFEHPPTPTSSSFCSFSVS